MRLEIILNKNSKRMSDADQTVLFETVVNGIEYFPTGGVSEVPLPWDASVNVTEDGKYVILEGYAGCRGYGYATVKLPIDLYSDSLSICICPHNHEEYTTVVEVLENNRWDFRWEEK